MAAPLQPHGREATPSNCTVWQTNSLVENFEKTYKEQSLCVDSSGVLLIVYSAGMKWKAKTVGMKGKAKTTPSTSPVLQKTCQTLNTGLGFAPVHLNPLVPLLPLFHLLPTTVSHGLGGKLYQSFRGSCLLLYGNKLHSSTAKYSCLPPSFALQTLQTILLLLLMRGPI